MDANNRRGSSLTLGIAPRRTRARWSVLVVSVAILSLAGFSAVYATLSGGSTFESGDGNLAVNTAGNHDWNSPVETINCGTAAQIPHSGTNCGTDLVKN